MTTMALDVSKYTDTVTPALIQRWRDWGCGLLIIQSHPVEYGQQRSLDIMRAAQAAGMPWDAYLYMYLGYPDWVPSALETLDLASQEDLVPRKVWGDVEDVDSGKGWTPQQRIEAVQRDLTLCDEWTAKHGMPWAGVYGAKWYWDGYLGNTTSFRYRQLWTAQYDNVADAAVFTSFGGWESCRIKQYAGSQPDGTDLDVLSEDEEADLGQPSPPPDAPPGCDYGWQDKKDLIVSTAGELLAVSDQLLAEANRKGGPRVRDIRRLSNEVRARAERILA